MLSTKERTNVLYRRVHACFLNQRGSNHHCPGQSESASSHSIGSASIAIFTILWLPTCQAAVTEPYLFRIEVRLSLALLARLIHRRIAFTIALWVAQNIAPIGWRPVRLFAFTVVGRTSVQDALPFGDRKYFVTQRANKDAVGCILSGNASNSFGSFQLVVNVFVVLAPIRSGVPRVSLNLELLPKVTRVFVHCIHEIKAREPIWAGIETSKTAKEGVITRYLNRGKVLEIFAGFLFVDVKSFGFGIVFDVRASRFDLFLKLASKTFLLDFH